MGKASDQIRPAVEVQFYEHVPLWNVRYDAQRNEELRPGFTIIKTEAIRDKYVYIFASVGSLEYGIDSSKEDLWRARTSAAAGYQHAAPLEPNGKRPAPSKAPAPEQAELEVYIDHKGLLWPISIAKTLDKPRHQRPHPKWGTKVPETATDLERREAKLASQNIVGMEWLKLSLESGGKPKRYYFFLSPFRLGPAGIKAAWKDIGTDALSLWIDEKESKAKNKLLALDPKRFQAHGQDRVGLVDPYRFARLISAHLVEKSLDGYLRFLTDFRAADGSAVNPDHFKSGKNEGTIQDLYFIASVLEGVQHIDEDVPEFLDHTRLEEVIGGYGWQLELRASTCEMAVRYLANWMLGPAHQVLDVSSVEDLNEDADPFSADDKAGCLAHWYLRVQYLGNTLTGTYFLTTVSSPPTDSLKNPLRDVFFAYEEAGKTLDLAGSDGKAFLSLNDIVCDMVLLSIFRVKDEYKGAGGLPDPDKAPDKAGDVANLMTNLGLFEATLGNSITAQKDPRMKLLKKTLGTEAKNFIKGGIYLLDGAGKMTDAFVTGRAMSSRPGLFAKEEIQQMSRPGFTSLSKDLKKLAAENEKLLDNAEKLTRKFASELDEAEALVRTFDDFDFSKVDDHWGYQAAEAVRKKAVDDLRTVNAQMDKDRNILKQKPGGSRKARESLRVRQAAAKERVEVARRQIPQLKEKIADNEQYMKQVEKQVGDAVKKRQTVDLIAELKKRTGVAVKSQAEAAEKLAMSSKRAGRMAAISRKSNEFTKATSGRAPSAHLMLSYATAAIELGYSYSVLTDDNSSGTDRFWAAGDMGKAVADVLKDYQKSIGVSTPAWKSLTDKASFSQKLGSQLSLTNVHGLMTIAAVVAGAYNVGKYGVKAIDGFLIGDKSTMAGGAIAAIGGLLSIASALGVAVVFSASGVGVIAGLLVVAGALIIAYGTDSEWVTFTEKSYFSKNAGNRNTRPTRPTLLGSPSTHWMGEMLDRESRGIPSTSLSDVKWGVANQRASLERLLSRFAVSSLAGATKVSERSVARTGGYEMEYEVDWSATLIIDTQMMPVGSRIEFSVLQRFGVMTPDGLRPRENTLISYTIKSGDGNAGPDSLKSQGIIVGRFAPSEGPGFVCILLKTRREKFVTEMDIDAKVTLTLADGTKIDCEHDILRFFWVYSYPPPEPTINLNAAPSFANNFRDAFDRGLVTPAP